MRLFSRSIYRATLGPSPLPLHHLNKVALFHVFPVSALAFRKSGYTQPLHFSGIPQKQPTTAFRHARPPSDTGQEGSKRLDDEYNQFRHPVQRYAAIECNGMPPLTWLPREFKISFTPKACGGDSKLLKTPFSWRSVG